MEEVLYIITRSIDSDLPSCSHGKAIAQSAHAANHLVYNNPGSVMIKSWLEQGAGFGTTIVLSGTANDIYSVLNQCETDKKVLSSAVYDPEYPYFVDSDVAPYIDTKYDTAPRVDRGKKVILFRREMTCCYLFGQKSDVQNYVVHLDLYA